MGRAGNRVPFDAILREDAGVKERLHQCEDALISDPTSHTAHQSRVVDLVEACRDVTFKHPLIGAGAKKVDLGNGVLRSTLRAEAVTTRLEVRLEDRFEYQLEGGLHHPVPHSRYAEAAEFSRRLWDHPFPHGQGLEPAGLQVDSQVVEKCLDAPLGLDVVGTLAVHARRAAAPVAPDPAPCLKEDGRIAHEVVEVTEPTVGGVGSPLVQLGLDSQYPQPGHFGSGHGASVFTGDLLACQSRHCGLAVPLRHVAGFPDLGLLRGLRPTLGPTADDEPARLRPGWSAGRAPPRWFPRSPLTGRRGWCPAFPLQPIHEYAAGFPRGPGADSSVADVGPLAREYRAPGLLLASPYLPDLSWC